MFALATTLHDYAIFGVAALVCISIPLCIGFWPTLICLSLSTALVGFTCLNTYAFNRTVSHVSGFAEPHARDSTSSSLDTNSLRSVSPTLCPPEYEEVKKLNEEFFKVATLRRPVNAVTTRIMNRKPRRARAPSEASTLQPEATSESSPPEYDAPIHGILDNSNTPTATPIKSRKRAATLPVLLTRAPSFSGFSLSPHENAPVSISPREATRPKPTVRIPSAVRPIAQGSSCKPSPSPAETSPCAPLTSVKSNPLRRSLKVLRRIPGRWNLKREEGTVLKRFDSMGFGPMQRSISVKGGNTNTRHDLCADLMVRCATVAA